MPTDSIPKIRDRVKELRRVKASELLDNPKNWRRHPKEQLDAIDAVLREIGFAGAELTFETPNGLMLFDGHARKERAGDEIVPVLVTDLTEEEADLLLASFDPIGAMAKADADALQSLVDNLEPDSASLRRLLDNLLESPDLVTTTEEGGTSTRSNTGDVNVEQMELQPEEHYDFILVLADNVNDWNRLVRLLDLPHVQLSRTHRRIGMARAVRAAKVLELIDRD